eukprot:TRINITY_DN71212_c0_g1_i1.p1 TRINITY_DN71212_c0_g1~~TRINITY_DN71212_c0_g1_i1.p1  ORF type:complete len:811 (-),score=318.58 TRINITY_DN71212_c0_g1_i1:764-3196(-)
MLVGRLEDAVMQFQFGREAGLAGLVGHQLQRAQQATAAGVAHQRMCQQIAQASGEMRFDAPAVLQQATFLVQAQHFQRHGGAHRMGRIGLAMADHGGQRRAIGNAAIDALRHHHRAHGRITGGQALGHRHQVGLHVFVLAGKHGTGAAEAGDDFIHHEEDIEFVAGQLHGLEPALGRHDHATRALDGFAEEGRYALGSQLGHLAAQCLHRGGDDGGIVGQFAAVGVGRGDVVLGRQRQVEVEVEVGQRRQSRAHRRGAVVAALQGDEMLLLRLADGVVIVRDVADGGIDRIRATQREIDMPQRGRADVHQLLGQQDGRFAGEMEVAGGIGQALHLLGGGADDALLAVAGVDAPQAGEGIQQFLVLVVGQVGTTAGLEDDGPQFFMLAEAGDGVDQVAAVEGSQGRGLHRGGLADDGVEQGSPRGRYNRHGVNAIPRPSRQLRKMRGRKSILMGFAGGLSIFCCGRLGGDSAQCLVDDGKQLHARIARRWRAMAHARDVVHAGHAQLVEPGRQARGGKHVDAHEGIRIGIDPVRDQALGALGVRRHYRADHATMAEAAHQREAQHLAITVQGHAFGNLQQRQQQLAAVHAGGAGIQFQQGRHIVLAHRTHTFTGRQRDQYRLRRGSLELVQHIFLHEAQLLVQRHAGRRGIDHEAAAIDLLGHMLHEAPPQAAPLQFGLHQQHADDGVGLAEGGADHRADHAQRCLRLRVLQQVALSHLQQEIPVVQPVRPLELQREAMAGPQVIRFHGPQRQRRHRRGSSGGGGCRRRWHDDSCWVRWMRGRPGLELALTDVLDVQVIVQAMDRAFAAIA